MKISNSFWGRKRKNEQYGREWYKKFPEVGKQKLAECIKKYYKM